MAIDDGPFEEFFNDIPLSRWAAKEDTGRVKDHRITGRWDEWRMLKPKECVSLPGHQIAYDSGPDSVPLAGHEIS